MKKRIYIAGSGGMLGEAFYAQFKEEYDIKCTDKDVNEDWLSFLDFRERGAYIKDVEDFNPDYLFHLGAYTDLEFCEENKDDTYATNTLSVENAVFIATVADRTVAVADHKARRAAINQKRSQAFFRTARCVIFPCGNKNNHKISMICARDKVFGAIDHPIPTRSHRRTFHPTHIRASFGFGHGQCVHPFTAHRRQQITFALFVLACHQDVLGSPKEMIERH